MAMRRKSATYGSSRTSRSPSPRPPDARRARGAWQNSYGSTARAKLSQGVTTTWNKGTSTWSFSGSNLPKSGVAILTLGFSSTKWGGLKLPFAVPGSASGWSGACGVYSSLDLLTALPTSANGTFSQRFSVSIDSRFHGLDVYAQVLAPDARANSFGLITSNGVHRHWIAPWSAVPTSFVDEVRGVSRAYRHEGLIIQLR